VFVVIFMAMHCRQLKVLLTAAGLQGKYFEESTVRESCFEI